ncbi:MAG: hypothetical protein HY299_08610 [Verrucomicrobia bacterium]|nr:hypothetical protein [Verrucomicrobiota bacterium]
MISLLIPRCTFGADGDTTGVVVALGGDPMAVVPQGLYDVVSIAAAPDKNIAVTKDGRVIEWSTATDAVVVATNALSIYQRDGRRLAILSDGNTLLWSSNQAGMNPFAGLKIVSGGVGTAWQSGNEKLDCVMGITTDGDVYCRHGNGVGTLEKIPGFSHAVAVRVGSFSHLALLSDGSTRRWLSTPTTQFDPWPGLPNAVAIEARGDSPEDSMIGYEDGTILWLRQYYQAAPQTTTNRMKGRIRQLCGGGPYALAVLEDGFVYTFNSSSGPSPEQQTFAGAPSHVEAAASTYYLGRVLLLYQTPILPRIVAQSTERFLGNSSSVTLETYVEGPGILRYEWRKGDAPIAGANQRFLELDGRSAESIGSYRLVACNPFGCVTSNVVLVNPAASPLPIQIPSSTADVGVGSLREAILNVNSAGGGTVSLSNLTGQIRLEHRLPLISGDVSILGPGADRLVITATISNSVFAISPESRSVISGIGFSGIRGDTSTRGAAIFNAGSLRIIGCGFERNSSILAGGAVFNTGQLEIRDSWFRSNSVFNATVFSDASQAEGGGGLSSFGGVVTLQNCAFYGNQLTGTPTRSSGLQPDGTTRAIPGQPAYGGAIYIRNTEATVADCYIANNQGLGGLDRGTGLGGGIFALGGTLTLERCTVSSNSVIGAYPGGNALGGGICLTGTVATIKSCSVLANVASPGGGYDTQRQSVYAGTADGGGIAALNGSLILINSTISENRAQGAETTDSRYLICNEKRGGVAKGGGASISSGVASFLNCTITANAALGGLGEGRVGCWGTETRGPGLGGGVFCQRAEITLLNTIVARNISGPITISPDLDGRFLSSGFNLIGNTNGAAGWVLSDVVGADPKLGPLQNNGGPTLTYAPGAASVVIDRGRSEGAPEMDQRGFSRPPGDGIDIGAVEVSPRIDRRVPRILGYETDVTLRVGERLALQAWVIGTPPLRWEWEKDGVHFPQESGANWSTDHATLQQGGVYKFRVRNDLGGVESESIHVRVVAPTFIQTWSPHQVTEDPSVSLKRIGFGSGLFVAVGGTPGVVFTSVDGAQWTERFRGTPSLRDLRGLGYYGGRFVAAGQGGILSSLDGTAWQIQSSKLTNTDASVAGGSAGFVVIGRQFDAQFQQNFWLSDGASGWALLENPPAFPLSLSFRLNTVAANSGWYVQGGSYGDIRSQDRSVWQSLPRPTAEDVGDTIAMLPVGSGFTEVINQLRSPNSTLFLSSQDGANSHRLGIFSNAPNYVSSAAYGDGEYLVGHLTPPRLRDEPWRAEIEASADALHWEKVLSVDLATGGPSFVDSTFGDGRFVFLHPIEGMAYVSASYDHADKPTLRVQGSGTIQTETELDHLPYNSPLTLKAVAGRWHRFDRWGDWVMSSSRTDLVSTVNDFTAIFSPTTRVETLLIGGVFRTAPVGMPAVLMDGRLASSSTLTHQREARLSVQTSFSNAVLSWTFDGSFPHPRSRPQPHELVLRHSGRLRVVAYPEDQSAPIEGDPIDVIIEPAFLLSANTAGGGTLSIDPSLSFYPPNTMASVRATPKAGWSFLGWEGDVASSVTPLKLAMTQDVKLEAVFGTLVPPPNSAGGIVQFDPNLTVYPFGSRIWMTASPSTAFAFAGWSGLPSDAPDRVSWIVGSSDPKPIAQFVRLKAGELSLVIRVTGGGTVLQNPAGGVFSKGRVVTLNAVSTPGQDFVAWTGDAVGNDPHLTVPMDRNKTITAQFTRRPSLTAVAWPPAGPTERVDLAIDGYPGTPYSIESNSGLGWAAFVAVTNGPRPSVVKVPITPGTPLRFFKASAAN